MRWKNWPKLLFFSFLPTVSPTALAVSVGWSWRPLRAAAVWLALAEAIASVTRRWAMAESKSQRPDACMVLSVRRCHVDSPPRSSSPMTTGASVKRPPPAILLNYYSVLVQDSSGAGHHLTLLFLAAGKTRLCLVTRKVSKIFH
ncbi:hypothetical protein PVAP13_1KG014386 [Panicum virgatum]|uniref:Secreted protein n=1 Tax=Panicum virgatum TaxID=38727 RepID=A0A8T0X1Z9_PANVG|nr:hypothetical protein PVAP13_1KG014386 [Panicum virgatum]